MYLNVQLSTAILESLGYSSCLTTVTLQETSYVNFWKPYSTLETTGHLGLDINEMTNHRQ